MHSKWTILGVAMAVCLALAWSAGPLPSSAAGTKDERTKIGAAGGNGGDAFVDNHLPKGAHVLGVKVRHGAVVDAVELLYKTAEGKVEGLGHHGGNGGSESTFLLNKGEYINGITGTTDGTHIVSIVIVTNQRKSDKFGGAPNEGKDKFSYVTQGDEVVGFYGRADSFVVQLGMLAAKK
jgi:hypothetical protein